MGGSSSKLDQTLFVWRKIRRNIGIMVTHVNDFCFGENEFFQDIIGTMKEKLMISEEKEDFRYLGMRVKNEEGRIMSSVCGSR